MDRIQSELNVHKEQKKKELSSDKMLNSIKGLLENDSAADRAMLRDMGLNKHIVKADEKHSALMDLEGFEKKTIGSVFSMSMLEKLAIDYRLKFLPSNRYSGTIDVEVPAKIKQFAKDNDIELNAMALQYKFFMLAPAECFDLDDVVIDRDPALFYQLDDKHYALVHKWGKDFTIFRAIVGWRFKNASTFTVFGLLMGLVMGALVSSLILPFSSYMGFPFLHLLIGAITGLITFCVCMTDNWNEGVIEQNMSKYSWTSNKRWK